MITLSDIFTLYGCIESTYFQPCENVNEFSLNNPKVLKLAAVKATSKAFRF